MYTRKKSKYYILHGKEEILKQEVHEYFSFSFPFFHLHCFPKIPVKRALKWRDRPPDFMLKLCRFRIQAGGGTNHVWRKAGFCPINALCSSSKCLPNPTGEKSDNSGPFSNFEVRFGKNCDTIPLKSLGIGFEIMQRKKHFGGLF